MTPSEYEIVVADIVSGICNGAANLGGLKLGSGRSNRLEGRSGYKHQIDVSLSSCTALYLIECKRWDDKIGIQEVMVLAARDTDISQLHPSANIKAILVSKTGATRGAKMLASHFGIDLEIVSSPREFGLRIGRHISLGVADSTALRDDASCEVVRNGVIVNE